MILGLQFAYPPFGIGLIARGGVVGQLSLDDNNGFGESLMEKIQWLLSEAGESVDSLRAIGVCTGPGRYTALRIGITTAKSIAQVLGIPVYGLSIFEAISHQYRHFPGLYFVVGKAPQSQLNCAVFGLGSDTPNRLTSDFSCSIEAMSDILNKLMEPVFVMGEIPEELRTNITNPNVRLCPTVLSGTVLAEMAAQLCEKSTPSHFQELKPVYFYPPNIGKRKARVVA